jgi:hypothetical protein
LPRTEPSSSWRARVDRVTKFLAEQLAQVAVERSQTPTLTGGVVLVCVAT